jgi:hypothetical protein
LGVVSATPLALWVTLGGGFGHPFGFMGVTVPKVVAVATPNFLFFFFSFFFLKKNIFFELKKNNLIRLLRGNL